MSAQHLKGIQARIWNAETIRNYIDHDESSGPEVWTNKYESDVRYETTLSKFTIRNRSEIGADLGIIKSVVLEKKQKVEEIRQLEKEIIRETSRLYNLSK